MGHPSREDGLGLRSHHCDAHSTKAAIQPGFAMTNALATWSLTIGYASIYPVRCGAKV